MNDLITNLIQQINQKYRQLPDFAQLPDVKILNRNLRKFKSPLTDEDLQLTQTAVNQYLNYLRFHECDLLISDFDDHIIYQRSKNPQRAQRKLNRWNQRPHLILSKYLNDTRGYRIILDHVHENENALLQQLEQLKHQKLLYHYYVKNNPFYRAIHCYIQPDNHHLAWELQIWDTTDAPRNYAEHDQYEQRTK